MSARKPIIDLLRKFLIGSGGNMNSIKECLAELSHTVETFNVDEAPTFPAALEVIAAVPSNKPSTYGCFVGSLLKFSDFSKYRRVDTDVNQHWDLQLVREIPLRLWNCVLPWELARGLSGVPREKLLPSINSQPTPQGEGGLGTFPATGEPVIPGMLFAPRDLTRGRTAMFWSGGINMSLDVAFFMRNDSKVKPAWSADMRNRNAQSPHICTQMESYGRLNPLPDVDAVEADRVMRLATVRKAPVSFRVQSKTSAVDFVMETASGFFDNVIASTFGNSTPPGDKDVPLDFSNVPTLQFQLRMSDELHRDVREKLLIHNEYIFGLECRIERLIRECKRYHGPKHGDVGVDMMTVRREQPELDFELFAHCFRLGLAGGGYNGDDQSLVWGDKCGIG